METTHKKDTSIATIEIYNNKLYIPAVMGFVDSIISNHRNYDVSNYNRFRFAATEILKTRIEKAYPGAKGKLYVDLSIKDGYFELSIRDKGVPQWADLSYDKEKIAVSREDMRRFMLDMCVDNAGMEKLGKEGQRVFVRQKIRNPLQFTPPAPYEEAEPLDKNITIKEVATEADAIEAIRCIYSEYGYSYAYEKLYYVDSFMEMIKNGDIMSFLAVNDHGQTAGHFALAFSDLYKNMPELSTVVTRREFRGLGLFAKFIDHAMNIAKERGLYAIMGQPVAFHPFSQKAFIRGGYTATSLLLSYINSDVESEYNKDNQRLDLLACVKMVNPDASCTLYPPCEIGGFVEKIYGRLDCKCTILKGEAYDCDTHVKIEDSATTQMKRVVLFESGADAGKILSDAVKNSIRKKQEMIELFISQRSPTAAVGYEAAKENGFILSGLMPAGEDDDFIVMQLLLKSERRYDHLVTEGDYTALVEDIIKLTEKQEEKK